MDLRDGYVIVMDGLVRRRRPVRIRVMRHLAGVHLRHSHSFLLVLMGLFFPQLLLQPQFQMVMTRQSTSPFPVRGSPPEFRKKRSQIKLINTVMTRLFRKSANRLPTSGISR